MTDEEFAALLAIASHERHGIEFKGPGPRQNDLLFAKVVRAAIGMANRRDGGLVIIGVEDKGRKINPVGLSDAELTTWHHDDVAPTMAAYTDPPISFTLEVRAHQGRRFVVMQVEEFEDVPVICRKPYKDDNGKVILRESGVYVRSRRKIETAEVSTYVDMRALLDLAIVKGVQRFVAQARAAGMDLSREAQPTAQDMFDRQLDDLK